MRRNPLLYSDHGEFEEPEVLEKPKKERSWLFYFIILANLLLVVFVLGIIWFLFFKSPDVQIKELTEQFFGTTPPKTEIKQNIAPVPTTRVKTSTVKPVSVEENDEIRQTRLKQMQQQKELEAERLRLEKIRAELDSKRKEVEETTKSVTIEAPKSAEVPKTPAPRTATGSPITSGKTQPPSTAQITSPQTTEKVPPPKEEPAIVPNAASEIPQPNTTADTEIDRIVEAMKQQQEEKERQNTSSLTNKEQENSPTNPKLLEKQLEDLITEKLENRESN